MSQFTMCKRLGLICILNISYHPGVSCSRADGVISRSHATPCHQEGPTSIMDVGQRILSGAVIGCSRRRHRVVAVRLKFF